MSTVYVKPGEGKIVRHPDGRILPPEGARVPQDAYWRRRLADGDVAIAKPPAQVAPSDAAAPVAKSKKSEG